MSYDVLIISVLSGGAAGGVIGAIVSHILTTRREAETRKLSRQKELTNFLADWKGKITTDRPENLPFLYNRELPHLQTKAAVVRQDLGEMQRAKFNELIGNLSRLTTKQITHPQGKLPQEIICEPLDALMGFMQALAERREGEWAARDNSAGAALITGAMTEWLVLPL